MKNEESGQLSAMSGQPETARRSAFSTHSFLPVFRDIDCFVFSLYFHFFMQATDIIRKYFDDITPRQEEQLIALQDVYTDWNSKINVISRKDIDALYEKHVLHSLSIAAIISFAAGTQIIDIGTGGGFPGVPLAIFFPGVQFHLVDSINKKLMVVKEVVTAIGLTNITTQHTRAEDIKNRKFDFAVSRAVAPLADLWRWSKPLLKKGHSQEHANGLISLKGGDLAKEIQESGTRPHLFEIDKIFDEEYFKEKYILHVPA